jgi:hypothetical protein
MHSKKCKYDQTGRCVRLVMRGYMGLEVVELFNLHRQSVSIYVQKFNDVGMDALLE